MKKFFYWLIFLYKYYLPSFKIYTKPIQTNFIKHQDVSAVIDPFIQAYIEFNNKYENKLNMEKYGNYFLKKFKKLLKNNKNKSISTVFYDIKAYFSSKLTRYNYNVRQINENFEQINKMLNNIIEKKTENVINNDKLKKILLDFLYNAIPNKYKKEIEKYQNKIMTFEDYYDLSHTLYDIKNLSNEIYNNLLNTIMNIPVIDDIMELLSSYVTEINKKEF